VNVTAGAGSIEIAGLTADSRAVAPGFLFAAIPGTKADGRRFIGPALDAGAAAVLAPEGTALPRETSAALVEARNVRAALARMAAAFYGAQPETMAAVTGTNGKTSVAHFTRQLWTLLGHRAASLGTLGLMLPDGTTRPSLTTPDPVTLHADLAALAADGVDHAVMEASSHGLEQSRLDGVRLRAAGFTNLSRDHLDYHGTEEAYFAAKRRLFSELLPDDGVAVLNADVPQFAALAAATKGEVISYGRAGDTLRILKAEPSETGMDLALSVYGEPIDVELALAGAFQSWNALCAAGLVLACGGDADAVMSALPRLEGVPGRLQPAGRAASGAPVYVDYAHTPDGLETVLRALRPHTSARLVAVFGCGGDRDRGKRPMMGAIGARLADVAIVTDDNPRSEDPASIRAEIMAAAPGATEIGDREAAIRHAVGLLAAGDVLVVAGKGHETGQIVGDTVRPFDDVAVCRAALVDAGGTAS
jgi:UDP-N-acetylmuramoyl-L-alanyl-D-glutamate--2,6-diaminopimelate ligase